MKAFVFFLFVLPLSVTAQYKDVIAGSLKNLKAVKGQASFNLVFNYDSMTVGRDIPEAVFVEGKKRDWEGKEAGKGEEFEKMWFADRKRRYEPTFARNFEKFAEIKTGNPEAKYTLIVKTTRTEGGWYAGVAQMEAELDLQLWVVETANQDKALVKISFTHSKGKKFQGGDFEMTARIQDAYMHSAKALGEFFRRNAK